MSGEDELRREVNEAARPVVEDICRMVTGLVEALGVRAVEEAIAAREAWEAEHPGIRWLQRCHCLCAHHDRAVCDEYATTFEVRMLYGEPAQLFLCRPCAELGR